MVRHCPRNHSARTARRKTSFILFKPLIAIASLTIMFELLPIDFQHVIAPSLVSYEEVFWSMPGYANFRSPQFFTTAEWNTASIQTETETSL